jgi:hypothetical protein
MDLGSILVILALFIFVAGYIARPILEKRGFSVSDDSRHLSELQAERDQILLVLQELDMDHAMGKIPSEDYEAQRPGLIARGAAILRELDELGALTPLNAVEPHGANGQEDDDLDAIIEKEILRRRKSSSKEISSFCTLCGNRLLSGDRFCTSCGAKVQLLETEA